MKKGIFTTLCYLQWEHAFLMRHRVAKKEDPHQDKWIGIEGKAKEGESPEEFRMRKPALEPDYSSAGVWVSEQLDG